MNDWSNQFHVVQALGKKRNAEKFASIYLLKDISNEELFVLKTIKKSSTNQSAVDRVRREANFNFKFEGLPEIHSQYETATDFSFVKKYQPGIGILDFLEKHPKSQKTKLLKQVFNAMAPIFELIEENGVVHCDLHPENILVATWKNQVHVELIDFGLATKLLESAKRPIHFNLAYSAPELILNRQSVIDHTTDFYALGMILFRIFEKEIAFKHSNPSVATNLAITYPLERTWKTPKMIWKIIEKACRKHHFKQSPNRMTKEDLDKRLIEGKQGRFQTFKALNQAIQTASRSRCSFTR